MAARGRRYFTMGQAVCANGTKTTAVLTSAATVRPGIYDMVIGASGSPADNAILWKLQRFTAAGTTSAFTPVACDPADPSSLSAGGQNATIEPTYTANLFLFWLALNQRATHRWVADPDGYIQAPATGSNGLGLFPTHASYTGNVDATIFFAE